MKILFLDESGDHNLTVIDENYPLFVLTGCLIDEVYHKNILTPKIVGFKKEIFGKKNIILHYVDYTRNQKGFESMSDKKFRESFYLKLNKIIKDTDFTLIACIIDKMKHKRRYELLAIDPYLLALEILVERFVKFLQVSKEKGVIIAESRGSQLDNELELAFLNLKINGTRFLQPKEITDNIEQFIIKKKGEDIAGLQLVDTLATPIGRRYLKKVNHYIDYETIKTKFRRIQCGRYKGYGLVILPRKKNG